MAKKSDSSLPLLWEKVKILSGIIASVLIPLIIGLTGHWYTNAIKERETEIRYVELAIGILREEPNEKTANLRDWAIRVINDFSPISLSDEVKEELRTQPVKSWGEINKALYDIILPKRGPIPSLPGVEK